MARHWVWSVRSGLWMPHGSGPTSSRWLSPHPTREEGAEALVEVTVEAVVGVEAVEAVDAEDAGGGRGGHSASGNAAFVLCWP